MKANKLNELYVMRRIGSKACDPIHGVDPKFKLTGKQGIALFKRNNGRCVYSNQDYKNGSDITFERINPLEVYTKENTILCTQTLNNLKGSTLDQFIHSELADDATKLRVLKMVTRRFEIYLKNKAQKIKGEPNEPEIEKDAG